MLACNPLTNADTIPSLSNAVGREALLRLGVGILVMGCWRAYSPLGKSPLPNLPAPKLSGQILNQAESFLCVAAQS